jgi:signal transduction histidine kinase
VVIAITTLLHVATSIDLGFQGLVIRIPLAAVSVLPLFATVALAHFLTHRSPLRRWVVLIAYGLGGAIRGYLLETGLIKFGLLQSTNPGFRILGGVALITIVALVVTYGWATGQRVRDTIEALDQETKSLQQALIAIQERANEQTADRLVDMSHTIVTELKRITTIGLDSQSATLQRLVDEVVRPLSHDFAQDIQKWSPSSQSTNRVTWRSVLGSLDPLRHLPRPGLAVTIVVVGTSASALTLFGWRNTAELFVAIGVMLSVSMAAGFWLARRVLADMASPLRDVLLTALFIAIAIPPAFGTTIALNDTDRPDVYVLPALITTPLFGWLIMTGGAAWQRALDVTKDLESTRDDLRWAIARINLLSWYHRGFISRLLHGAVQNTIQVGILRLRGADDDDAAVEILAGVIRRIDEAIQQGSTTQSLAQEELKAIDEVATTWGGVADVAVAMSGECRAALTGDPAAAGIVVDLVQEICSNAIRHGGARQMTVACSLGPKVITIHIADNGSPVSGWTMGSGLGTRFLDSCAVYWARGRDSNTNSFVMAIPVEVI